MIIFSIIIVLVGAIWIISSPRPEHIEDTNDNDNYSLQTITNKDVVEQKMGIRGVVSEKEIQFNLGGLNVLSGTKYSSDKFTGVYLLNTSTLFKGSDIYISVVDFNITSGNFSFFIVFDNEVIGQLYPTDNGFSEFILENVEKTGTL